MTDDPGLTTAEQAEAQLTEARNHIYMLLSTQPRYDEPPELPPGAYEAVQDLEAAARAAVQTREEKLRAALTEIYDMHTIPADQYTERYPGRAGDYDVADIARVALTTTEQGGPDD